MLTPTLKSTVLQSWFLGLQHCGDLEAGMGQVWYIKVKEKTVGPVTPALLRKGVKEAKINPETKLRLGDDGEWIAAAKVKGLFNDASKKNAQTRSQRRAQRAANQRSNSGAKPVPNANPYAPTAILDAKDATAMPDQPPRASYRGMSRLMFWIATFTLPIAVEILAEIFSAVLGELAALPIAILGIAHVTAIFAITALRLINIGKSGWWCLALLIPIVNLLIFLRCLACPAGYAIHKKLDRAGKVICVLLIGLIAMGIIMLFFV